MAEGSPELPESGNEEGVEPLETVAPLLPEAPVGQSLFQNDEDPLGEPTHRPLSPLAIVFAFLAPFVWAGIVAGLGFFLLLMLAFMSDAGFKNESLQNAALLATMVCLVVVGIAGIPLGIGIGIRKIRRPAFITAGIIAGIGVIATF
ncbi:MAG: hypothetical protein AAGC68_07995, partial [Verrucomicrobiota bacterium]